MIEHFLPYGRYRGCPPRSVPVDYLLWFVRNCKTSTGLRAAIRSELLSRGVPASRLPPEPKIRPARCPRCGGFADVLAIHPDHWGALAVQCTTRSNQVARLKKALALPALRVWLQCGCRFSVWSWARVGRRGQRKTCQVSQHDVTLADLEAQPPSLTG
jgi:hypothetical protein